MKRLMALLVSIATVLFVLQMPVQLAESAKSPEQVKFSAPAGIPDPNEIFALVNKERIAIGLTPLQPNSSLANIANQRAQDMAARRYYAHKNPDGLYFYDYFSYQENSKYACENLDLAFTTNVGSYVEDWMNSTSGHRECMLNADIKAAGYAAAPFETVDGYGVKTQSYIIVAIHSASAL